MKSLAESVLIPALPALCSWRIHFSSLEWDYPFGAGLLEISGGPSFCVARHCFKTGLGNPREHALL